MSTLIRSSRLAWTPEPFGRATIARPRRPIPTSRPVPAERLAAAGPGPLVKRAIDLVGALAALMLLWPVMLAVALAIRLDSPGPMVFRQWRLGRDGRPFCLLKFRTMVVDAERRLGDLEPRNESAGGVLFKLRNDPRVTRPGQFLRRSSLDELPQLINVLRGEMSLVGPRPCRSGTAIGSAMRTRRATPAASPCGPA